MKKHYFPAFIFLCCWLTYLTAYLCRVNFSAAITGMSKDLSISVEQLGIVGAVFFGVYAVGQLVNGFLGDRVHPSRFLMLSLCGMAVCNVAVSYCKTFLGILIFWGMNGYFQSIVWSTIIRILANTIEPEKRAGVSAGISTSITAGYIISWSVLGQLLLDRPHSLYFQIPAACAVLLMVVWLVIPRFFRGMDMQQVEMLPPRRIGETILFIRRNNLYLLCFICMLHGLIKEGISFWLPLLLSDIIVLPAISPAVLLAIIPVANLMGMFLSKWLLQKRGLPPVFILLGAFSLMTLSCVMLIFVNGAFLIIALITLVSCFSYACNTILMAYIPMQFIKENMVASLVGIFDCASYMGAAFSAYILGKMMRISGLSLASRVWTLAGSLAVAFSLILLMKTRLQKQKGVSI